MRRRSDAGVAVRHLFLAGRHTRDELPEIAGWKILLGDECHRRFRDHPNRFKILYRIVAEVAVECGIGRMAKVHH